MSNVEFVTVTPIIIEPGLTRTFASVAIHSRLATCPRTLWLPIVHSVTKLTGIPSIRLSFMKSFHRGEKIVSKCPVSDQLRFQALSEDEQWI
jgi:hypothetical protein